MISSLCQAVERKSGEVVQLEKKLRAEMARSREHHNKTVADMEKLIEAEKRRGQQAIDYVRNTLKVITPFLLPISDRWAILIVLCSSLASRSSSSSWTMAATPSPPTRRRSALSRRA